MRASLIIATMGLCTATAFAASPASPLHSQLPAAANGPPTHPTATLAPHKRPAPVEHYVDLNSASRHELMTLPGVGPAEADRIVKHRPYRTKTELVSKGAMPTGPFLSLKHLVVAMPPGLVAQTKKKQDKAQAAASQPQARP